MCGIIGYVGPKDCRSIVFQGLKRLEYRGYDSAGIAVIDENRRISLIRAEGKLQNLEPQLDSLPPAHIGIGHTRWATHGEPSVRNAHPHMSEELALVHNGIIENYKDFKIGLEAAGVKFSSDTDTEVVLHLLANELGTDTKAALMSLAQKLKGAFSLGIIHPAEPDAVYLVKQGSPVVIGVGHGEMFFSSDASALVGDCDKVVYLNDGQMARLTKDQLTMWSFDGQDIQPEYKKLDLSKDSIEKRGFAHFMLKEIHEQPSVMRSMQAKFLPGGKLDTKALGLDTINLNQIEMIHFVACGTAYLSSMVARYIIEAQCNIPVNVELASEFRYRKPFIRPGHLLIAVSQSGETMDTLEALKFAKKCGAQTLTVCNVDESSLAREAHAKMLMTAGPEIGVASTKAFTAMILSHFFLCQGIRKYREGMEFEQGSLEMLTKVSSQIESILGMGSVFKRLAEKYYDYRSFLFIGRGQHYPLAIEGALKLKEISYIHAEAYAAGELKHGPIALIDPNMPVLALCPHNEHYSKVLSGIEQIVARNGKVLAVATRTDKHLADLCEDIIIVPESEDVTMQTILCTLPLQLFAYEVAIRRGTDVDQPRNLAKSVTVE
jgi:glutamine---fructose-6-phosphate transaminase (isomerizing)